MGKLLNGYIMPHPPIIVPGIGHGREREAGATIDALKRAAKEIGKARPTTILLSTPHAPCFRDFVYIMDSENLEGDFAAFGSPKAQLSFQNNRELVSMIAVKSAIYGIDAGGLEESQRRHYGISDRLDHGALVPLSFIKEEWEDFRLVCISTPFLAFEALYDFGRGVRDAIEESGERVVYIASGDLSHRLTRDAPAGYSPKGPAYDRALVEKVRQADVQGLLETDLSELEKAGECGTRSIVMMFGAFDGRKPKSEVYSYEGPYGVGYLVAKIEGAEEKGKKKAGEGSLEINSSEASVHVRLAKETLETYVRSGNKIKVPDWVPPEFKTRRAGVFVSLKKGGMLRGCIGTIGPVMVNIAEEIINNAISAGMQDPRFPAVKEKELNELIYSVDVLGAPEKINSTEELDVKRYGVIVTAGFRRGLLLPDLEGVDTPEKQVEIALQKAGIRSSESFELKRFEVIRYR
ncbi:MAG: AmmeMemoRadiSam system protein A [Eubacteriales bacterium]|nr:AmmeMemoRadiSam system protein A [Eubacteriales bacterium]